MKIRLFTLLGASVLAGVPAFAQIGTFEPAPCETGVFRTDQANFVAVTKTDNGYNYTFSDGIVGNMQTPGALVECGKDAVRISARDIWPRIPMTETNTRFAVGGVMLAGRLMLPPGAGKDTPLVVYAHGSEASGWIDRARDPYQMVGRGIAVFVYDKRGTGLSNGDYSQNFPRLADDLVAASAEAKRLAQGHYGRFGLIGLSQGGWIVPLAANRVHAEFLGIGYGLAVDIAEQDEAQVAKELRDHAYGDDIIAKGKTVTDITARLVKSAYQDGMDDLATLQQAYGKERWFTGIKGGYTGVFVGMPVDELRKNGIPQFARMNIDWSVHPMQVLDTVDVPQLWAFADEDRQAPGAITLERLAQLRGRGHAITLYRFPDTDHGMWEYAEAQDGARKHVRIAPGFYELMADWAKGKLDGKYGKAYRQ